MTESKVDASAVLGGGPDEVSYYPGDVEWKLTFGLGWHVCVPTGGDCLGSRAGIYLFHPVIPLNLLVCGSPLPTCSLGLDLLLPPRLKIGSQRQRFNNFPCIPSESIVLKVIIFDQNGLKTLPVDLSRPKPVETKMPSVEPVLPRAGYPTMPECGGSTSDEPR